MYALYNSYDITLIQPNSSSAIHTGLNQSNLIGVVANGSTLDLYVNNQKIDSVSDSAHRGCMKRLLAPVRIDELCRPDEPFQKPLRALFVHRGQDFRGK